MNSVYKSMRSLSSRSSKWSGSSGGLSEGLVGSENLLLNLERAGSPSSFGITLNSNKLSCRGSIYNR